MRVRGCGAKFSGSIVSVFSFSDQIATITNYRDGVRDGVFESFYRSGHREHRYSFDNGQIEVMQQWYDDGRIAKVGRYKNLKKHGRWREWDYDGNLILEEWWNEGDRVQGPLVQ